MLNVLTVPLQEIIIRGTLQKNEMVVGKKSDFRMIYERMHLIFIEY